MLNDKYLRDQYELLKFLTSPDVSFDDKLDLFKFGVVVGMTASEVMHGSLDEDIEAMDRYGMEYLKDPKFGIAMSETLADAIKRINEAKKLYG